MSSNNDTVDRLRRLAPGMRLVHMIAPEFSVVAHNPKLANSPDKVAEALLWTHGQEAQEIFLYRTDSQEKR